MVTKICSTSTPGEERAIAQLARSTGTYWITATGSDQFATEFEELGHGVFTYSLIEGLKGMADNGDSKITILIVLPSSIGIMAVDGLDLDTMKRVTARS